MPDSFPQQNTHLHTSIYCHLPHWCWTPNCAVTRWSKGWYEIKLCRILIHLIVKRPRETDFHLPTVVTVRLSPKFMRNSQPVAWSILAYVQWLEVFRATIVTSLSYAAMITLNYGYVAHATPMWTGNDGTLSCRRPTTTRHFSCLIRMLRHVLHHAVCNSYDAYRRARLVDDAGIVFERTALARHFQTSAQQVSWAFHRFYRCRHWRRWLLNTRPCMPKPCACMNTWALWVRARGRHRTSDDAHRYPETYEPQADRFGEVIAEFSPSVTDLACASHQAVIVALTRRCSAFLYSTDQNPGQMRKSQWSHQTALRRAMTLATFFSTNAYCLQATFVLSIRATPSLTKLANNCSAKVI